MGELWVKTLLTHFSVPQSPHLCNGGNNTYRWVWLWSGWEEKESRGAEEPHSEDRLREELYTGCSPWGRFRCLSMGAGLVVGVGGRDSLEWCLFLQKPQCSHFHPKQNETGLKALNYSATKAWSCIQPHFSPHLHFVCHVGGKETFQGCDF